MTTNDSTHARKPLRLWPPIAIMAAYVLAVLFGPILSPDLGELVPMAGAVIAALLIALWWVLFSRARWTQRIGVVLLMAIAVPLTRTAVDPSIAGGAQGYLAYIFGFAAYAFAIAVWSIATASATDQRRLMALLPAFLIVGTAPMLAIRTEGVKGGAFILHWRWTPTPEQLLLAENDEPKPLPAAPNTSPPVAAPAPQAPAPHAPEAPQAPKAPHAPQALEAPLAPAEWPGFRGPNRDGVIHTVRIRTDWNQVPPALIWRRAVGPGWSSFSVRGDLIYTQEQRGDDEIVSCYRLSTGEPVWRHRDAIRFYESNGGAGPRGTPTIHGNYIFTMGATGQLNALDAATGKVLWAHDASSDTKREIPMWGISSSPLVVDDLVIVAVYGTLAAYDIVSGTRRWVGPSHGGSYSSPHLATFDDVRQVVILSSPGAVSVNPADGQLLWEHKWEGGAIVQPGFTEEGDILINAMAATGGLGTRRLHITRDSNAWKVEERWTSNGLKPYFNDLVVHKGHAYGFDGAILSSIDLADGKRKWKGGRYGNGQMVLLADQDLLLIVSEEGELALVSATPDQYKELARIPALDAKTWNHPVVVGSVLLVRNGEEMAAYRLTVSEPAVTAR